MEVAKRPSNPSNHVHVEREATKAEALRLLGEGQTPREVCNTLKVGYDCLWAWRTRDKEFAAQLLEIRRERMSSHRADIESAVTRALEFVTQTIDDEDAPPAVRLRAAEGILDRAGFESGSGSRGTAEAAPIDAEGEVDLLKSIMADPRLMAMLDRMRGGGTL